MLHWLLQLHSDSVQPGVAETAWAGSRTVGLLQSLAGSTGMMALQKVDAVRARVIEAERAAEERAAAAQAAFAAAQESSSGMISWLSSSVQAAAESAFGGGEHAGDAGGAGLEKGVPRSTSDIGSVTREAEGSTGAGLGRSPSHGVDSCAGGAPS